MKKKDLKIGQNAREAIEKVATNFRDYVGSTLGPGGRNWSLPNGITNDGRSIVEHIRYEDECEDDIAITLAEGALKTDKDVGDGTTTTVVVETQLVISTLPHVPDIAEPGNSVMDIARQLEAENDKTLALLEKSSRKVEGLEELKHVAFTSMEDREVGNLIAEAVFEGGKDGYTAVDEGFSGKVEKSHTAGVKFPMHVVAPFMYTNNRNEAVHEQAHVIVANHIFEAYAEITPLMTSVLEAVKEKKTAFSAIVIIGRQFSIPFIGQVANVVRRTQFPMVLIQANIDDEAFKDIAAFTDAQYLDTTPKGDKKVTDLKIQHAGLVKRVIAGKKETVLIGGRGMEAVVFTKESEPKTRVAARVDEIKALLEKETIAGNREAMEKRIACLSGGITTVFVDAKTAVDRFYLKLKAIDAVNACKAALEGGVVKGGGLALKEAAETLGEKSLLYPALVQPHKMIQNNAGGMLEIPDTVLDPLLVVQAAVSNAVSIVKRLITVQGIIADHVPDPAGDFFKKFEGE